MRMIPIYAITIITFALLGIIINLLWLFSIEAIENIKSFADIFNKTAVGVGAIMGGIGGLKYFEAWIRKNDPKEYIDRLKKFYSYDNYSKGAFKVVQKESEKGKIYTLHVKESKLHHIANYPTFLDIELNRYEIETLRDEEFDKYILGQKILTSQPKYR